MDDQFFINQLKKKTWAFPGLYLFGGIGILAKGSFNERVFVLSLAILTAMVWLLLLKYSDKANHKELLTSIVFGVTGVLFLVSTIKVFDSPQHKKLVVIITIVSQIATLLFTSYQIQKLKERLWDIGTLTFDEFAYKDRSARFTQIGMFTVVIFAMRLTEDLATNTKELVFFYSLLVAGAMFLSLGIWHLGFFITTVKLNRQHNVNFRDKYLLLLREQNNNSVNQ